MNRKFRPRGYFTVPDGTVAAGRIGPHVHSWIHVHPAVTQVTYVVGGALTIRMKDARSAAPYDLRLKSGEAVVSQPGTLFQLRNDHEAAAEVLYIVTPSYAFEMNGAEVTHDDAILVAKTWEELVAANYRVPALEVTEYEAKARRAEAIRRLALRKGISSSQTMSICSLRKDYDYLAPDGSEIRLAAQGQHGGFAHCVLPAGKTSTAVRHRTVEELWYVLDGTGEVWRSVDGARPRKDAIAPGDSLRIQVGTAFQFRAAEDGDLKLLLATMPPWPGSQEAVPVESLANVRRKQDDGRSNRAGQRRTTSRVSPSTDQDRARSKRDRGRDRA